MDPSKVFTSVIHSVLASKPPRAGTAEAAMALVAGNVDVSKESPWIKCFAASKIIRSPPFTESMRARILGLIGSMAESVIGTDYLHNELHREAWWPDEPAQDFHDANFGFASARQYIAFLCDHNSHVDPATVTRLVERALPGPDGQLLCIPDFVSHAAPQAMRFYEVKPDSPSGTDEADKKMAFVHAFMQALDLRYEPGVSWRPDRDFPFFKGLVFGMLVTVSFHYERHKRIQGVVVYHFCIRASMLIPLKLLLLILAIVISVILFPEIPFPDPLPLPIPSPIPIPIPVPVPASGMSVDEDPPIRQSVGEGGRNEAEDVCIAQLLLNTWMAECGQALLQIDGVAGTLTAEAIRSFQREYLPQSVNGRLEPDGPEVNALSLLSLRDIIRHADRETTLASRAHLPTMTQSMPGKELMELLYRLARQTD